MSENEVIRVRDLCRPPWVETWQWGEVLDRVGSLVIATIIGAKATETVCPDGVTRTLVEHVLNYNNDSFARMTRTIKEVLGPPEPMSDPDEPWDPEDPDGWKEGREDEREFGPQGDWWK